MPIFEGPHPDAPMKPGQSNSGASLPFIPIYVAAVRDGYASPHPYQGWALLDTGSGACLIDPTVRGLQGLTPIGSSSVRSLGAREECRVYRVAIGLDNRSFETFEVTEQSLAHMGCAVLLGMNWFPGKTFVVGPGRGFTLSW